MLRKKAQKAEGIKAWCIYMVLKGTETENAAKVGENHITEGPKCQAKKLGLEAVSYRESRRFFEARCT